MTVSNRTASRLLIYAPTLHRQLAPPAVPPGVLFMHPGLPLDGTPPPGTAGDGWFHPAGYPFPPAEAASALADLLAAGEALGIADDPGLWAGAAAAKSGGLPRSLSAGEKDRLKRFAGIAPAAASAGANPPAGAPAAAQRVLLLTWDLEERLLELAELREKVLSAGGALAASLRDPVGTEDENPAAVHAAARDLFFTPPDTAASGPDWRPCLAAMAAFMPPEAVFVSAHPEMRQHMLDAGMLLPLPEEAAECIADWPPHLRAATLWACLPLWRALGHSRPPENSPHLSRSPEMLLCPAG